MSAGEQVVVGGETSFGELLRASVADSWRLDDVLPRDRELDFSRPFLPWSLTELSPCPAALSPAQALRLNQLMGKAYVNLFHFVEEFIIEDVRRAAAELPPRSDEGGALSRFASEEVKHQELFQRFMAAFDRGIGRPCPVLDFERRVARIVLSTSPLAVLLTTFHLEIITQEHYLQAISSSSGLEPSMVSILEYHWRDEARHASIDLLELEKMLVGMGDREKREGFKQYCEVIRSIHRLLSVQARHDLDSLQSLEGPVGTEREVAALVALQHVGYSRIFVELGLRHTAFGEVVQKHFPSGAEHMAILLSELSAP